MRYAIVIEKAERHEYRRLSVSDVAALQRP